MSDAPMLGPMPEDEKTIAFLRMVLPEEGLGHYVVAVKASKGMQHVFLKTINDLGATLFDVDRSGHDCYFALACYRENSSRNAANATYLKSLRLDIDVGKGDGSYASTQDAAVGVAKFCHTASLPRPIIVESGSGGLHVYWPLSRSLPPIEWKPYADGLKRLCTQHGLLADAVCTSDVARVLRAPGTHNRKPRVNKKVVVNFLDQVQPYPIETFQHLLAVAPSRPESNVVPLRPATLPSTLGPMPAFLEGAPLPSLAPSIAVEQNFAPAYGALAAKKCAQLAAMRDTGGRLLEPEWKACIGVLAFCQDGEELAHEWSKGDERYDPTETQRKFDASKLTGGPITCAHFRGLNARCNDCPQTCVTPKQLGESLFAPTPAEGPKDLRLESPFVSWDNSEKGGKRPKSLTNAFMSMRYFGVVCRYDAFHDKATVEHPELARFGDRLCDAHVRHLRVMMVTEHGHDPGFDTCWNAVKTQCERNHYDPIVEYLDNLRWDGVHRLDRWLADYLGADHSKLHEAFGRKTLLAAVRRARRPGAKFDFMLVLEGMQGTGKTSAVQMLAGEGNFSEQKILHLDTKAQAEQIAGKWLYEISELAGLHGRAVEDVKQFISRLSDEARPAYGREPVDRPRRCIFIGTTNNQRYLHDETGNRRFWPVKTGAVDLEGLKRDRDQLWAEAAYYEAKGESLFLARELWADATEAQEARRLEDPWEEVLRGVQGAMTDCGTDVEHRISMNELFFAHIKAQADRLTGSQSKRLTSVMHSLGWEGPKTMWFEGGTKRGFYKRVMKS